MSTPPNKDPELNAHADDCETTAILEQQLAATLGKLVNLQGFFDEVIAEKCGSDDQHHCSCVPPLRAEIARLNAALASQMAAKDCQDLDRLDR